MILKVNIFLFIFIISLCKNAFSQSMDFASFKVKALIDTRNSMTELEKLSEYIQVETRRHGYDSSKNPKIAIIGDSMAGDMMRGMYLNFGGAIFGNVVILGVPNKCQFMIANTDFINPNRDITTTFCNNKVLGVISSDFVKAADLIIIASMWYEYADPKYVTTAVELLRKKTNGKVVVNLRNYEFSNFPNSLLKTKDLKSFEEMVYKDSNSHTHLNKSLKNGLIGTGVTIFHPQELQCQSNSCKVLDQGKLLYYDCCHWTNDGAKYFVSEMFRLQPFRQYRLN